MKNKLGRWVGFALVLLLIVAALNKTARLSTIKGEPNKVEKYAKWDAELVKEFSSLPVQDGGRVKPFASWAGFELLALNGKRKIKFESEGKKVSIGQVEWAMDCMFRPELADTMEFFQVENDEILDMVEMPHEGKKRRDRYSLEVVVPYLSNVDKVYQDLNKKRQGDEKLSPVEDQFVAFAQNIRTYLSLRSHFEPVREPFFKKGGTPISEELKLFSSWMSRWPELSQTLAASVDQGLNSRDALMQIVSKIEQRVGPSVYSQIAMMPPADVETKAWPKRGDWLKKYVELKAAPDADQITYLIEMEKLALAYHKDGQTGLLAAVKAYKAKIEPLMKQRFEGGMNNEARNYEGENIASELLYYRMDYFYNSLAPFIFGFLVVAAGWLSPATRWGRICNRVGWVMLIIGSALVIAAITHRCILMGRAPVGNLYDTIPFIVAICLIVLGFMEYITKRGVCLGMAFFLAVAGVFLSIWYEESKGVDHMNPLIAVLRSNFWLATHVITVTMGYAGGLLTAGLSHVYIFARVFNIDEGDKNFRRFMTRIVYGGICFTLFFGLVGTILGGIWANDSWGRFWGWDPKENGALIIVLWCLVILHARLGGYLREWGLHICSVIGSILVTFSWWHVNFLNTGLHTYGFTGGDGLKAIWAFYYLEMIVVLVALGYAIHENEMRKTKGKEKLAQLSAEQ